MAKLIQRFDKRLRPAPNGRKYSKFPTGNAPLITLLSTSSTVSENASFTVVVAREGDLAATASVVWTVTGVQTTPQTGTLSWAAGDGANKSVTVAAGFVAVDTSGTVTLSSPASDGVQPLLGVSTGSVLVQNVPAVLSLTSTSISVNEGSTAQLAVSRSGGVDAAIAVDYAVTGVQTTPQTGAISWASGVTGQRTATITANAVNATTTGTVTLSNPRRTDGGNNADSPTLGVATGSITVVDTAPPPSWNLPASISVTQGSFVGIRQYAVNATGAVLNVTGLSGGLSYNAGLERIEATAQSTASVTATFTINGGVATQRQVSALVLGAEYTLANATAGLPFTVNTPIPPTITSEATVTPATLAANLVNGRRVTLSAGAGTYSGFTINTTDQEFIIQSGCTIGRVSIGGAARRIIVRGNPFRAHTMTGISLPEYGAAPENIFINGVYANGTQPNYFPGNRVAVLNSFIRAEEYPISQWAVVANNLIFANCNIESYGSTQSGVRFSHVNNLVFVDCRVLKVNDGNHFTWRQHSEGVATSNSYVCRNLMGQAANVVWNPRGTGTDNGGSITNIWIENNQFHIANTFSSAFLRVSEVPNRVNAVRCRNNQFFGNTTTIFGNDLGAWIGPDWIIENNGFSGYTVLPPREFQ